MKEYKIEFLVSDSELVFTDGGRGSTHIYLEWTSDGSMLLAKRHRMISVIREGGKEVWEPAGEGIVVATFAKDIIYRATLIETSGLSIPGS